MLNRTELIDCLNLLASVSFHKIEISEMRIDIYDRQLVSLTQENLAVATEHFYNQRIFPTPQEILEFLGEVEPIDSDWYKIVGVARQSSKEETIAHQSLAALIKITSSNGMRSGLLAIARADDNQLNRYRTDWKKEFSRTGDSKDGKQLEAADETISLEIPVSQQDIDYPVDHDYSIRTASLIRLLKNNEIKPETAKSICSRFPEVRRVEVSRYIDDGVDVNERVLELCF